MPTLTQQSPAKINLFLHITGKRPDGYHNLQTVFRLIDLYDTLTFSHTDKTIGDNLPVNPDQCRARHRQPCRQSDY